MEQFKIASILCLLFLSAGCDKWEPNAEVMIGKIKKIQDESKKTIGEYTYNQYGELVESWHSEDFYSENKKREYTYTYNSEKQLIGKKGYEPGISFMSSMTGAMGKNVDYAYEYDSIGKIRQITIAYDYKSDLNLNYSKKISFQYPNDSLIIETTMFIYPSANTVDGYLEYHINSNGNIGKKINYYKMSETEFRVSDETIFTYDTKNVSFEPEPVPVSKNNMLTKTITSFNYDEYGHIMATHSSKYSYEYTYTPDGYPESRIETYPNGVTFINYYKY